MLLSQGEVLPTPGQSVTNSRANCYQSARAKCDWAKCYNTNVQYFPYIYILIKFTVHLSQHYNNLEVLIIFFFSILNIYTMCMKIRLLQFFTNIACTVFSIVHIFIICWYPNLLFFCIFKKNVCSFKICPYFIYCSLMILQNSRKLL